MKTSDCRRRHRRWLNVPTLSHLAFLQRSPVVKVAATAERFVFASPIGTILKSAAVTIASLGLLINAAETGAPSVPARIGAYAPFATGVDLSWLAAESGNVATSYKVERATDSEFTADLVTFTTANAATGYFDGTAASNTHYFYRLSATNAAGSSAPTAAIQVVTPASNGDGRTVFANIATRAFCGTGDSVTIGGFVITGETPKRVLVRAVGPTLTAQGIGAAEVLVNPTIKVYRGPDVIAENDDWGTNQNAGEITTIAGQIGASPFSAGDTTSSALLRMMDPGVYSFVVSGSGGSSGIVLLEVYDADQGGGGSKFSNIATRAFSTSGNGVTIGGFVLAGGWTKSVMLRAVGSTLTTQGIGQSEVLEDPTIELYQGARMIAINDSWRHNSNGRDIVTMGAGIGATPFAGADTKSAALLLSLRPGVYSFIARGRGDASGIVLVDIYDADSDDPGIGYWDY
jgi:hypothetical protein